MDLATVFADIDRVDWSVPDHAYGPAEDVPGLLRALASGDPDAAAEAEHELWSSLVHQGTVYRATVRAVPFLARLMAAGVRRPALLEMIGAIAESTDEYDLEDQGPGAARAAVAAQVSLLLPMLCHDDPGVRQRAAWAVAQCGPAAGAEARAALRSRGVAEADPLVRADVLTAWLKVDPGASDVVCAAAFAAAEPTAVRVAALLALVDTGRAWNGEAVAAAAALLPLKLHAAGSVWEREPLKALALGLYERGDADAAVDVVVAALHRVAGGDRADGQGAAGAAEAVWAAGSLALRSRTAPARLLPAMLPLLDDPEAAHDVVSAVRDWAEPAPEAVPALIRLAEGDGEPADRALAALVSQGAPEAADLLARRLPQRPQALDEAFSRTLRRPPSPLPCAPTLLDAVRARLAVLTAEAGTPRERRPLMAGGLAAVNEPVHLMGLLAGWGPSARAALPELTDALSPHGHTACRALATIADGTRDVQVVAALRARAGAGSLSERQTAAAALHALTGEADPLVGVLREALAAPGGDHGAYVRAAAALGEEARPLVPDLLELLAEPAPARAHVPAVRTALDAAALVWELTRDGRQVLPLVVEGLSWAARPWGRQAVERAAEVAGLLGPAAQAAVPHLLPLIDRPDTVAAAARALVAIHPGDTRPAGIRLTDLADRVLGAVTPGVFAHTALAALEALDALGPSAFTPALRERLRLLADGDRRIVGSGSHTDIIRDDREVRSAARRLSARLAR